MPYDRFRDRVIFPISDWRGRVIAFGGRALDKDVSAKYLNSPETPLFHKGATLYNIAAARKAAHDGARVIAVEGYVDVIAMVTAGFEATVAPLGTALTAEQLALMWRMADEPILCFDGDDAGRRAAYRAVDLALPLLKPGKSLKLATLPDGQDPDDLARSGGREAIEDVLGGGASAGACACGRARAKPVRSIRRSGAPRFEARVAEVTATIADEAVRRYYRQDFSARLRQLFAPAEVSTRRAQLCDKAAGFGDRGFGGKRFERKRPRPTAGAAAWPPAVGAFGRDDTYVAASAQLAASPLHRGHRAAIPRREALILQAALNHPWLLHDHLEELAAAEFRHADTQKLKGALIDVFAHHFAEDFGKDAIQMPMPQVGASAALAAELAKRGFADLLGRIERTITTPSVWGARPEAAAADVLLTWKQLVALHRQWHSLTRELKDAETALGAGQYRGELRAVARRQSPAVLARRNRGPDRGLRRVVGPGVEVAVIGAGSPRTGKAAGWTQGRRRGNKRSPSRFRVSRSLTEFRQIWPRFGRCSGGFPRSALPFLAVGRPPRRGCASGPTTGDCGP